MPSHKRRISPTEIESREDSLAEGDELSDYTTLDGGLKAISAALKVVVVVGVVVLLAFAGLAGLYVQHEAAADRQVEQRRERTINERNALIEGVCAVIEDVSHTSTQALIAAASLDGVPPTDAVIAAYVDPIEEAIDRCFDQIPPVR